MKDRSEPVTVKGSGCRRAIGNPYPEKAAAAMNLSQETCLPMPKETAAMLGAIRCRARSWPRCASPRLPEHGSVRGFLPRAGLRRVPCAPPAEPPRSRRGAGLPEGPEGAARRSIT